MNNLYLVLAAIIMFLLSVSWVRVFCDYAIRRGIVAVPNDRSFHKNIIPRVSGIVFALLWTLTLLLAFVFNWFSPKQLLILLPGVLMVTSVGFWDDYKALTPKKRLIVQILAASLCVAMVGEIPSLHLFGRSIVYLGHWGIVLTLLGLVWSTNIYNFMDGLDGIAAVEGMFVFGIGGLLFWSEGAKHMALIVWALVPLLAGFLVWNWPKARVFMGDAGSYFLGFLVALFALLGDRWYNIPVAIWVILYSVFWFDATLTVLRRFFRRENLAIAHREHAYHRLHRLGFSHIQMLFGIIALNCVLSSIVVWTMLQPHCLKWGVVLTVVILSIIYGIIEKLKPMAPVK